MTVHKMISILARLLNHFTTWSHYFKHYSWADLGGSELPPTPPFHRILCENTNCADTEILHHMAALALRSRWTTIAPFQQLRKTAADGRTKFRKRLIDTYTCNQIILYFFIKSTSRVKADPTRVSLKLRETVNDGLFHRRAMRDGDTQAPRRHLSALISASIRAVSRRRISGLASSTDSCTGLTNAIPCETSSTFTHRLKPNVPCGREKHK